MSSVKQSQILSQRIATLERRVAKFETLDEILHKILVMKASDEVDIICGDARLSLKKDGTVVIRAKDFDVGASGQASIKAAGNLTHKGSKILQN
jgi:hypothetical protein